MSNLSLVDYYTNLFITTSNSKWISSHLLKDFWKEKEDRAALDLILFFPLFQRIDVLVQERRYQEALALAQSFYDNKAKAVVGLSGPSPRRREIIADLVGT